MRIVYLSLLLSLLPAVSVATQRTVRVAYYPEPGQIEKLRNGMFVGATIDYLTRIAQVNDWKIEPVEVDYVTGLKAVEKGEIDLIGGVTPTAERIEKLRFASHATGLYRSMLFAHPSSVYRTGRADTWNGIEIGCGPGDQAQKLLVDYLNRMKVNYRLRQYVSAKDAILAFSRGEVPACFATGTAAFLSSRLLISFSPVPSYFCTPRNDSELGRELDAGVLKVYELEPDLEDRVQLKNFPVLPCLDTSFSDRESEWLTNAVARSRPLTVDISQLMPPLKTWDQKANVPTGFAASLFQMLSRRTGLRFDFVTPIGHDAARERFHRGEVDIWLRLGSRILDNPNEGDNVFVMSIPQVAVYRAGEEPASNGVVRVAILRGDVDRRRAYERAGVKFMVEVDNGAEMVNAVLTGKADIMVCSYPEALYHMRKHRTWNRLEVRPPDIRFGWEPVLSLSISPLASPMMSAVLDKCLGGIGHRELFELVCQATNEAVPEPLFNDEQWALLVSVISVLMVFVITELYLRYRKDMKDALARAVAGETAKTNFLATMSHEIRTPLNAIIGFSQCLKNGGASEAQQKSYIEGVDRSSRVLLALLNDILDLTKIGSGKVDPRQGVTDLHELCRDVLDVFSAKADTKGIKLVSDVAADIPTVKFSPSSMRHILINLIGNAVKFTDHGQVSLSVVFSRNPDATVDVSVQVADTGVGIDKESRSRVFNEFEQGHSVRGTRVYEGTGLGLPIVRRLVECAGGELALESEVGKGSVFTVRLPRLEVVKISSEKKVRQASAGPLTFGLETSVLAVDDIRINLRVLVALLNQLGVSDVRTASSGAEALEKLAKRPAELVISDLWMPGMSGTELAREIRKLPDGGKLKLFALTADNAATENNDMSDFDGVLTKPITQEELSRLFVTDSDRR